MTSEKLIRYTALAADTLVKAGSTFREDKKKAYTQAISRETDSKSRWILETILENAEAAEKSCGPLCDDTGIPHIVLDVGANQCVTGSMIAAIREGVRQGLRTLPGRPMAIMGDDTHRLDQSGGLDPDPAALEAAPILIRETAEDILKLHILMFGGGPAIRGRTYRVFHKHDTANIMNQIVEWGIQSVKELGCSPCTLAVGIGRSQYEAASLMLQAQVDGRYDVVSPMEAEITERINRANIGALGLGGDISVLGTFLKVGPQRASGVRIVCLRPCCCFEPRIASCILEDNRK